LPLTQLPPSPIKIVEMCVVNGMLVHVLALDESFLQPLTFDIFNSGTEDIRSE